MKKTLFLLSLIISGTVFAQNLKVPRTYSMPEGINEADYLSKTIVIKFKEDQRPFCTEITNTNPEIEEVFYTLGVSRVWKKFKSSSKPIKERNSWGAKYADLSLIYEVEYTADIDLENAINYLYSTKTIIYAEPHFVYHFSYTPNDALISLETHLNKINAYQAFDSTKGDTSVVIGIVDSGFDVNHEDLEDEVKHNYDDPINGLDDDADGYIDNFSGWDFVNDDNVPQAVSEEHGVHVSGCASPSTDNVIGVAGPGFNTMLLPVRAGDNNIAYGYEGIVYCADQNAHIINCSWGGSFGSQTGQDAITYATINKNALVVAAAGNSNVSDDFFPAAYDYVLSVAATEISDAKSGYSNYGYSIDVCAPGTIYATLDDGGYGVMSGTSMASPVVAGSAALVKSRYPLLNGLQIGEHLKNTADDISSMNPGYNNMLGAGRINLGDAMGAIDKPSIDMIEKLVTDNNDDAFVVGDVLSISGTYVNYLASTNNLVATISTSSPYINVTNSSFSIGTLSTLQSIDNSAAPFTAEILVGTPLNTDVEFEIEITNGSETWLEYLTITVNVDYINININDVGTTITSKGMIGYNLDGQQQGLGFTYMNSESILWDAALMVGIQGEVVDMVRGAAGTSDQDFSPVSNVNKLSVPVFSEFDVEGVFSDATSTGDKLGIEVSHKAFAWTIPGHTKYVVVEYDIENQSGGTLDGLYAGIYGDWDVSDATANVCETNASKFLGYTYDVGVGGVFAGVQLLTDGGFNHYAMYNNGTDDPSNNNVNPNDSYNSAEKYITLSTYKASAGGSGADVSNVVSSGPFSLQDGENVVVAFALIAGDDASDLLQSADSAYAMYNNGELLSGISNTSVQNNVEIYPNPARDVIYVNLKENNFSNVKLSLIDITGKIVINHELANNQGTSTFDCSIVEPGVYLLSVEMDGITTTERVILY